MKAILNVTKRVGLVALAVLLIGTISGCLSTTVPHQVQVHQEVAPETDTVDAADPAETELNARIANAQLAALLKDSKQGGIEAGNVLVTDPSGKAAFSMVLASTTLGKKSVLESGALVVYPSQSATSATSEGGIPSSFKYNVIDEEAAQRVAAEGLTAEHIKELNATGIPTNLLPVGEYGSVEAAEMAAFSMILNGVRVDEDAKIKSGALVVYPSPAATSASSEGGLPTVPYKLVPIQ